ncbi:DUF4386 domain-containing protein [Pseudonocardia charpentierae]|uniref:DUF4386 domain-containing protein n=1 Tax=Pseudonocardia charpentierae TaxID=3075545 RepID=A0ABU2NKB6_9PSEU|nr:DUF4386 domain-containing protein [Pseudonocardia sp. DSM 45834]MDT0353878.1 DUF4386 domain-containing protein [Pseudonocardia sp. DSM 45834]
MTATATATTPTTPDSTRRAALVAGTFYLITFAASIPAAFVLLPPLLDDPGYIVGAGADTSVIWGCLLDTVNALAGIGTAVALFPVVKRQNEALALGFVTTRLLEAAVIMIGVVSLLAVVTLRQDAAAVSGADTIALVVTGNALVAVRDWTFLLGPSLMAALNALLLGTLMYRSRLVPRIIPAMGLIGAPLLLAATTATLFGQFEQLSVVPSIAALPVAAWELSLGIYLVVKGFKPSRITATETSPAARQVASPVT